MFLRQISIPLWTVIVLIGIGFILDIVSFGLPWWNNLHTETWGLWQRCTATGCELLTSRHTLSDVMRVGRVCHVVALVAYVALVVQTTLFLKWRRDTRLLTGAILTAFGILFLLLFGALMWASGANTSLSWSYYICYLSGLSAAGAGGLLIHVRRQEVLNSGPRDTGEHV